jgi:hypothetical protein
VNPISVDRSLKHWRQMLRPYLRMRPALCVQTRLRTDVSKVFPASNYPSFFDSCMLKGRCTILLIPCRSCVGASTRPIRETCWVGFEGFGGWPWKLKFTLDDVDSSFLKLSIPLDLVLMCSRSWGDLKLWWCAWLHNFESRRVERGPED